MSEISEKVTTCEHFSSKSKTDSHYKILKVMMCIPTISLQVCTITSSCLFSTGKILVTGNTDHRVGIWDLNYIYRDLASENPLKEGYEVVRDFCAHGDAVNSVA